MRKNIVIILILLLSVVSTKAQERRESIAMLSNEKWWGMTTSLASKMPYLESVDINIKDSINNNISANILLSSNGRYIYSEKPFKVEFGDKKSFVLTYDGQINILRSGKTLREAYLSVYQKFIKKDSLDINKDFIKLPFAYIDGDFDPANEASLNCGLEILKKDSAILVLSRFWQQSNGDFEFGKSKISTIKAEIEKLHSEGKKVYLWVSPLLTSDSRSYINSENLGHILKNPSSKKPIFVEWDGGVSALYDLNNSAVREYISLKLKYLVDTYAVDGFLFAKKGMRSLSEQTSKEFADHYFKNWNELSSLYSQSSIVEGGLESPSAQMVVKLSDKYYNWENIKNIVPEVISNGLLGRSFTAIGSDLGCNCSEEISDDRQLLMVRIAQISAFMPIFSLPMCVNHLSESNRKAIESAVLQNKKINDYMLSLVDESVRTGAPIIRNLEYEFPRKSFYDCKDQFMVGSKYLVAPFFGRENSREVRLPSGYWVDDQGNKLKGPRVIKVSGEIDRIPYFECVKGGFKNYLK